MKKSELIALLAGYPDDMDVYVSGYEGGYDLLTSVEVKPISPYNGGDKWVGRFRDDGTSGAESIVLV
jgi:hypothetical protein